MKKIAIALFFSAAILAALTFFFSFTSLGYGLFNWFDNQRQGDPVIPAQVETVMPKGSVITATTEAGQITIRAEQGLKRTYEWEGVKRSVVMWPRGERWYGSLGIYYPGPGYHWFPKHNGISRGVLEEGQQHFATKTEAFTWLDEIKKWDPTVYTDQGLVVSFGKTIERQQLNVSVWQILLNDKLPTSLAGSQNEAIQTSWNY